MLSAVKNFFRNVTFRSKTLTVLREVYGYEPNLSGSQGTTFGIITTRALNTGVNEHDAAATFMLVQVNVLAESKKSVGIEADEKQLIFVRNILDTITQNLQKSAHPTGLLGFFAEVVTNYGLQNEYPPDAIEYLKVRFKSK